MTNGDNGTKGGTGVNNGTAPALPTFTFASGKHVQYRRVSHYLEQEVRRSLPAPEPPVIPVDYGGKEPVMEPNYADPDFKQALQAHALIIRERQLRLFLVRGAVFYLEKDELLEITVLRAEMGAIGVTLNEDDRFVWLYDLCITSEDELIAFVEAIRGTSQPTEVAIQEAVATFPGNIQGN